MQHLIIIPGLSDRTGKLEFVTRDWKNKHQIIPHVFSFGWQGKDKNFESRLSAIGKEVDKLIESGERVSLLGTSAGGSVVINLFYPRRNKISKVINVCGRFSKVENIKPVTNYDLTLFKDSVVNCEKITKKLSKKDKEKILTIRPLYDEIVSTKDMTMEGANNKRVVSLEHLTSISLAMTIYSDIIIDFLNS